MNMALSTWFHPSQRYSRKSNSSLYPVINCIINQFKPVSSTSSSWGLATSKIELFKTIVTPGCL